MSIENKIKELEIERILVVDDTSKNIEGAKAYFSTLSNIQPQYATDTEQAKKMIQENKYDLILTDLEMENKKSGLEVVSKGFGHLAYGFIVTGREGSGGHGPSTNIEPNLGSINGRKDNPEIWESTFTKVLNYLDNEGKKTFDSLKRFKKYVGGPSEEIEKLCNTLYSHI